MNKICNKKSSQQTKVENRSKNTNNFNIYIHIYILAIHVYLLEINIYVYICVSLVVEEAERPQILLVYLEQAEKKELLKEQHQYYENTKNKKKNQILAKI